MSIIKCKMCGGTIEFEPGATVGVCDSCGTAQTLPRLDDERRANLYDRANHFRRNNEFDKAMGIYEQILNEDNTDAEAYWSLVLCRYGIEYVEDPATRKRVPTVNRTQFTSIFDDDNYKSALQYADSYQRTIYEQEAAAINEIQKGILAISQKEEPFDVFICYKETDNNGRRTPDSVLANDLYHQLKQEGFKVFFSRITLEDKLGTAYEPYIFAALNSARVMVVLGTRAEYFNAVWVKNEWSRYLALVKQSGGKKVLIPAYRDMDPYDLPDEFSHLQAQDMSRLGFMQDLIRGIRKIIRTDDNSTAKTAAAPESAAASVTATLKRAFLYLEDGDWENANAYCERALDVEPENAQAYLAKLMVDLRCRRQADLKDCELPFDDNGNYQKAIRFGTAALKAELQGDVQHIKARNEEARCSGIYNAAMQLMESTRKEDLSLAAEKFAMIPGYRDADEKAAEAQKDAIYISATAKQKEDTIPLLQNAIEEFSQISGWLDADARISDCEKRIDEIARADEKARRESARKKARSRKIAMISISSVSVAAIFLALLFTTILPTMKYRDAVRAYEEKDFDGAVAAFTELGDFKDSADKVPEVRYAKALYLYEAAQYDDAAALFAELGDYSDAADKVKEVTYAKALDLLENKNYKDAYETFLTIKDYGDSAEKLKQSGYCYAVELIDRQDFDAAIDVLANHVGKYQDSSDLLNTCYLKSAEAHYAAQEYDIALAMYKKVKNYDQSSELFLECIYQEAIHTTDYKRAVALITNNLEGYKDSDEVCLERKYLYVQKYKSNYDQTTYSYLKDLKAVDYKDSATIFEDLYAWKIKFLCVNTSETDEKTNLSSVSRYSSWYFHYELTGGEPGASTKIHATGRFPDGSQSSSKTDDSWKNGWTGWWSFYYGNPSYGATGDFTVTFYDDAGNVIGTKSIRITA